MAALIRTLYYLSTLHDNNTAGAHLHSRSHNAPPPPRYEVITGGTKAGFIALGTCGLISLLATASLFLFLTHRFIFSSRYYSYPLWRNQYVVLIYNLLIADMQQATAFLLCLHWVVKGKIWYPSAACVLQGWWIQTADPGSGLFVIAIALHTGAVVLRGRQVPYPVFVGCIVGLWTFILVLGFIPVGLYGKETFVISEAGWCWLSPTHEKERLWGHYIWIFLSEFGTIALYSSITIYLRRRMAAATLKAQTHAYNRSPREAHALKRLNRVVLYMLVYPASYVILSLPLAAGRMSSARHVIPSRAYFAVAGCLMALSGAVDTAVYALTRRQLLVNTEGGSSGGLLAGTGPVGRIYAHGEGHLFQTHISAGRSGSGNWDDDDKLEKEGNDGWMGWAGRRLRRGKQSLGALAGVGSRADAQGSMEEIVRSGVDRGLNKEDLEMRDMDSEAMSTVGGVYQETTFEIRTERVGREPGGQSGYPYQKEPSDRGD
ncbi:hypothetical protein BDW74DRAFT_178867 [Aspergillus multicolor]|uniref:uncharacterized protein n=1 Tax=Aspergillus multicolor TaxID=41759 RepID=UPI003CCDB75C